MPCFFKEFFQVDLMDLRPGFRGKSAELHNLVENGLCEHGEFQKLFDLGGLFDRGHEVNYFSKRSLNNS